MTQIITEVKENKSEKPKTLMQYFLDKKSTLELALPRHLNADRMLRIVCGEILKTPKLKECTLPSLFGSVLQASLLGLEPGGALGHCYLIPYKDYKNNVTTCQFIIGYRGMLDLARRSGQLKTLSVRAVYENDKFSYSYGLKEKCKHVEAEKDKGKFIGAYAVAHLKDGGYQFEYMKAEDINKIRDKSLGYSKGKSSIWDSHYEEMAKKTVIRRLFKLMPISIELQMAVGLDEEADRGAQINGLLVSIDDELNEPVEKIDPIKRITESLKI